MPRCYTRCRILTPEQLVRVEDDLPGVRAQDAGISIPEWKDMERSGIFQYVVLQSFGSVNLLFAAVTDTV
jgi:hypothetical protein